MSPFLKGNQASKAVPQMEWQKCDNEAEWQSRQTSEATTEPVSPAAQYPHQLLRHWRFALIVLAFLTVFGGWTWYQAQKGLAQITTELGESVQVDLWTAPKDEQKGNSPFSIADLEAMRPLTSSVQLLSLTGDVAIVRLTMQPAADQPALRQSRLYQLTERGWQRIAPTTVLWGSPRHKQTRYFDFHYYGQDEDSVTAVAAMIDNLYESLTINFVPANLDAANNRVKIEIEVNPTQAYASIATRPNPATPLVVASPAIYLAPVTISEKQLLAQSIMLSLLKESQVEAIKRNDVPEIWQALVADLHLWQVWQLELPLAEWQKPLLTWMLSALDPSQLGVNAKEPTFAPQLCAMHQLWMQSPLNIRIPLPCDSQQPANNLPVVGQGAGESPLTLARLMPVDPGPLQLSPIRPPYAGAELMMTTLFDYIVATYGKDRLVKLVESLHDYPTWETLAPAVFGVSAAEFEEGWRRFLVERYNVSCRLAELKC